MGLLNLTTDYTDNTDEENGEVRMTNDEGMTKPECCRVRCPQRTCMEVVNTPPFSVEDSGRYSRTATPTSSVESA